MSLVSRPARRMRPISRNHRSALVIAHPGHELLVYNWLSLVNPCVFVLTDGSGHSRKSRLHRTTSILNSLGARPGSIYGRLTDAEAYSAILAGEVGVFISMAGELAEALVLNRIEYIVGDAIEGFNPVHDVCRLIINAAVTKVCRMGYCVDNFDVVPAYKPDDAPKAMTDIVWIAAGERMLAEKLQVARDYAELAVEVNRIIAQEGIMSLATEYLRPVHENSYDQVLQERPYYELYGMKQVAAGRYQQVIGYRDHVFPIGEALKEFSRGLAVR